jgi:riboflavin kinase/FMN adenylyltransferase
VLDGTAYRRLGPGVANVGVRPTQGEGELRAEAHVLGFSGDLYGKSLRLHLVHRLRDEKRFDSIAELESQLDQDKHAAAERLRQRTPDPDAHGAWH